MYRGQYTYANIVLDITRKIISGEYQDKLPATRELTEQYQVARQTLFNSLQLLYCNGIIYGDGRRGIKIDRSKIPSFNIGIIFWRSKYRFFEDVAYDTIQNMIAKDNCRSSIISVDVWDKKLVCDKLHGFDGVMFPSISLFTADVQEFFHQNSIKYVVENGNPLCLPYDSVGFNTFKALDDLTNELVQKGYRKIGLLFPTSAEGVDGVLKRKWNVIKKKYGLICGAWDDFHYINMNNSKKIYYKDLSEYPEILIFWNPVLTENFAEFNAFLEHIPECIPVLARFSAIAAKNFKIPERIIEFKYPEFSIFFESMWNILFKRLLMPDLSQQAMALPYPLKFSRPIPHKKDQNI